jgi:serine/threonine protein kinase
MWSYMCIFSQLLFGYHPFTHVWGAAELVPHLFKVFGPLPIEWKGRYIESGTVSDASYGRSQSLPPLFHSIIAGGLPNISPSMRSHLVSVLSNGFRYQPGQRITAAQLLENPSFMALTATP